MVTTNETSMLPAALLSDRVTRIARAQAVSPLPNFNDSLQSNPSLPPTTYIASIDFSAHLTYVIQVFRAIESAYTPRCGYFLVRAIDLSLRPQTPDQFARLNPIMGGVKGQLIRAGYSEGLHHNWECRGQHRADGGVKYRAILWRLPPGSRQSSDLDWGKAWMFNGLDNSAQRLGGPELMEQNGSRMSILCR